MRGDWSPVPELWSLRGRVGKVVVKRVLLLLRDGLLGSAFGDEPDTTQTELGLVVVMNTV